MSKKNLVSLTLNGQRVSDKVSENRTLAEYLHEYKGLSGTKVCCGIGVCRACTVAVKRPNQEGLESVQACVTPLSSLEGASVQTVEGLNQGSDLHPLQVAFLKHFSFQCGYSTSGFLMGSLVLLDDLKRNPVQRDKVDDAIVAAVGDNVCRCTGYTRYYAAIKEVVLNTPGLVKA